MVQTPADQIEKCQTFGGLSHQAAGKIESYMHFRQPVTLLKKSPLERARIDQSLDFMDTIADDIPKVCAPLCVCGCFSLDLSFDPSRPLSTSLSLSLCAHARRGFWFAPFPGMMLLTSSLSFFPRLSFSFILLLCLLCLLP